MEIKLNKELQKKLDDFLIIKDEKLCKFLKILNLEEFTFSKEEINNIEEYYRKDKSIYEYIYIYIGEAVIKVSGGFWSVGKFKKDSAYSLPIILAWGGDDYNPRISPKAWLYYIDINNLGKSLGDMIYSL